MNVLPDAASFAGAGYTIFVWGFVVLRPDLRSTYLVKI